MAREMKGKETGLVAPSPSLTYGKGNERKTPMAKETARKECCFAMKQRTSSVKTRTTFNKLSVSVICTIGSIPLDPFTRYKSQENKIDYLVF